ncbi:hypothetical protein NUW58_g2361 [Xylaria curta]|uniref:Uncharacterized protein n=1 Tax=Xylaria curta TaxID=42375 RepID=A0ACC1PFY4_9PEZI|nr:hypothetical protein NUW58_g2361 [Xylaria curta]
MAQSPRTLEEQLNATSGFSDLTIVCQGVEFATHRFIVCAHSEVLTAALAGDFSEAESQTVNMDFDLDSVKRFLEFLYTGDYNEIPDPALELIMSVPTHDEETEGATVQQNIEQATVFYDGEDDQNAAADFFALANLQFGNLTINAVDKTAESWICHCRMSSMADYYNVTRLSTISLAKLEEGLRSEWCVRSFCTLLVECLNEIGNRDTLRLLGNIAAEHCNVLAILGFFEPEGPGERLAPFVLAGCIKKLNETEALRKEAEGRCEQLNFGIGAYVGEDNVGANKERVWVHHDLDWSDEQGVDWLKKYIATWLPVLPESEVQEHWDELERITNGVKVPLETPLVMVFATKRA